MSRLPGAGIAFDILGNAAQLDRTLLDAERRISSTAADINRISADVKVSMDLKEFDERAQHVRDTIDRLSKLAPTVKMPGTFFAPNNFAPTAGDGAIGRASSSAAAGDAINLVNSRFGKLTIGLYTVSQVANAAADSTRNLTKQIEDATSAATAAGRAGGLMLDFLTKLPIA